MFDRKLFTTGPERKLLREHILEKLNEAAGGAEFEIFWYDNAQRDEYYPYFRHKLTNCRLAVQPRPGEHPYNIMLHGNRLFVLKADGYFNAKLVVERCRETPNRWKKE